MRIPIVLCLMGSLLPLPARGQSEQVDQYSVGLVQRALKLHQQGISLSFIEKNIPRLGDQVSVALVKIFAEPELSNPQIIESFLPLIQKSFSEPKFISGEADKKPQVTLLLLKCVAQNISDAQTREEIMKTIQYVNHQTLLSAG